MKKSSFIKKQILLIIILSILIPPIVLFIISAIRFQKFSVELAQNNMEKAADECVYQVKYKLYCLFVAVNTYGNIPSNNINSDKSINFTNEQLNRIQAGCLKADSKATREYSDCLGSLNSLNNVFLFYATVKFCNLDNVKMLN
ncbi:MAG: hypothetical protein L3J74_10640 [Bacteroidales bacterium]|nr:hypothetical protein [Bacteroidales bacterium]